jgi:hypothetical protein
MRKIEVYFLVNPRSCNRDAMICHESSGLWIGAKPDNPACPQDTIARPFVSHGRIIVFT